MLAAFIPHTGAFDASNNLCTLFDGHASSFGESVKGSILVNLCRWAEIQLLVNNKSLLFCASGAHTKAAKVIKYVTQYGTEVHQTLSNAGLAPVLYQLVQLPGAFMQVSLLLSHSFACFVDSNKSCHCPAALPCCSFYVIETICPGGDGAAC